MHDGMPTLALPIRTRRLELRALTPADLDNHLRVFGDPDVVRYLYDEPMDRDAAEAHLARRLDPSLPTVDGTWMNLAATLDGEYLGEMGLGLASAVHKQCEVGYVFLPTAAGHGYATEATAACIDLAFTHLDAHRVVGRLDARNERSAALLRRLGMRHEATLRENEWVKGEWTDEAVYAITVDEWRGLRSGPAWSPLSGLN